MRNSKNLWNLEKIEKSYVFFEHAEKTGSRFTIQDICDATGYTKGTVKSYQSKKWSWFIHRDGEKFYSQGLHNHSKKKFIAIHQQKYSLINKNPSDPASSDYLLLLGLIISIAAYYKLTRYWPQIYLYRSWMPWWSLRWPL